MNMRVLCIVVALVAVLILGPARASAWTKDSDSSVDTAMLSSIVTQLLAPDATLGDADTTAVGVGDVPVGIDGSLATYDASTSSSSSSSNTFIVDNTPLNGDCPNANYTTIQAAVTASGPGDTVKVCPGTYPEQVRITGHGHDKLKLESLKPLQAIIKWPTAESPPLALVDFNTADQVSLRGFTIAGPFTFPSCSPDRHEGVLVENAFDESIDHNHITMIANSVAGLRGCQEGDAVAIGHRIGTCSGTAQGSADLKDNLIDEYQKNGVQVFNPGSSAEVDHNEIVGPAGTVQPHAASNGVVVLCGAAAEIEHNVIRNNLFTGSFFLATSGGVIVADAPPGSSEVDHNSIVNNDYGIETDSQNKLEIEHNDVLQSVTDGIVLCGDTGQGCGPATGIVVRSNEVENNGGNGIVLFDADSNLLKSNHVEDNGTASSDTTDGIRLDANSGGNQIRDNHLDGNVTHDCHDDSTGTGTAFTANFWTANHGNTENKPGLCTGH
jgi:parallel beta-helix repeat protein